MSEVFKKKKKLLVVLPIPTWTVLWEFDDPVYVNKQSFTSYVGRSSSKVS